MMYRDIVDGGLPTTVGYVPSKNANLLQRACCIRSLVVPKITEFVRTRLACMLNRGEYLHRVLLVNVPQMYGR